jgi:KGK domain
VERKIELADDDVVYMKTAELSLAKEKMTKMVQIRESVKNFVQDPLKVWISHDIECEVLQTHGRGWIKGKMKTRVIVEFVAEEPDSPLDDLRHELIDREFG